jgi:hypothetical protein
MQIIRSIGQVHLKVSPLIHNKDFSDRHLGDANTYQAKVFMNKGDRNSRES